VVTIALAASLGLGILPLRSVVGVASAQAADAAALVRQFAAAVNRGDAVAAAALFSDDANYTAYGACQSGCKDRAEIVDAITSQKLPNQPESYAVEQSCGDTAAVLVQKRGGDTYDLETFRASGGRLTAHIRDPRLSLSGNAARAAAAEVCLAVKPLTLPAGASAAEDPENAAVLARFFNRVNQGDSRGAAALFSDAGTYRTMARATAPAPTEPKSRWRSARPSGLTRPTGSPSSRSVGTRWRW
jgi:ketosteroid isomerase-like protein